MSKMTVSCITAVLMMLAASPLAAEGDHSAAATHGGQYAEVEGHHGVELVATADALTFHLTDDHKPMDLTGAQFKAVVQTGNATNMVELAIDGSALKGALKAPLPSGAKIVLTGKDRHGHALQARFVKQ